MRRGTTPTHIFTVEFDTSEITLLNVAYSQDGEVVVEKSLDDCTIEPNKIIVNLTEEDTLKFTNLDSIVEIQLRVGIGDARYASDIIKVRVGRLLKDGELDEI